MTSAATGARRPPSRRPAAPAADPAVQLPPVPRRWVGQSMLCLTAGIAAFGAAPLLRHPALAIPALAVGVLLAAARAVFGRRAAVRGGLTDRLVEALSPGLGLRAPDRRAVRARRWTRGWPGAPRRVELRYAARVDDTDPAWLPELLTTVKRRLMADYRLHGHDRARCRISLRWVPPGAAPPGAPPAQLRAERTIGELLGPTAAVTGVEWSGGDLAAMEVRHQAATKVAARGYRVRVERVLSTMLPGRWRAVWDLEGDGVRFEVRPSLPSSIWLPAAIPDDIDDLLSNYREVKIPYAVDEDGRELAWYPARVPQAMLTGGTGTGKALACSTPIATPSGWTTMGDLSVGDIVFDDAGRPCTVTGAFDQPPDRPCNEVVFSDGSVIIADDDHLWWTEDRSARRSRFRSRAERARRSRLSSPVRARLEQTLADIDPAATLTIKGAVALGSPDVPASRVRRAARSVGAAGSTTFVQTALYADSEVFPRRRVLTALSGYASSRGRIEGLTASVGVLDAAGGPSGSTHITLDEVAALLGITSRTSSGYKHLRRVITSLGVFPDADAPVAVKHVRRHAGRVPFYPAGALLDRVLAESSGPFADQRETRIVGAVRTTAQIAATLRTPAGRHNHSIPVAGPLQIREATLPIPPYVLGVWLGDGDTSGAVLTSADPQVVDLLDQEGVRCHQRPDPLRYGLSWGESPRWLPLPQRGCVGCGCAFRPRVVRQRRCQPGCAAAGSTRTAAATTVVCTSCEVPLKSGERTSTCYACRRDRATVRGALRSLGVLGNKHIPAIYLRAGIQQRRALLAGLLDTDGTVSPQGTVHFDNTIERLARDVLELVLTLGHRATISVKDAILDGRNCGPTYRVAFTTAEQVFRLHRKKVTHEKRAARHNRERTSHRYIVDVRPVPSVPVRCITVDSPNRLFLAGRTLIPTHNTSMAHTLLGKITQYGWPVWVLDAKRVEFLNFRTWPNVQIVAGSIAQQVALVRRVWELMEYRYQLIEDGTASVNDFEPLVVFLDEFAEFRSNLMEWYAQIKVKGDPTRPPPLAEVASLARKARTARIHLVLSTQRPDAEFLGGEALATDTPLPTPTGWTTMGEIAVGQHVLAEDGRAVRVTAATEVAEQRPCYRVTFSDGSTIVTDENHRWAARNALQRAGDAAAARRLTRGERWPGQVRLAARLARMAVEGQLEVTVSEFEARVGQGRIGLLRWGIHDGRFGVEPVGVRPGLSGRFAARIYRSGDLLTALQSEVRSPPPTWRSGEAKVVTTGEMFRSLHYHPNGASNWAVQVAQPLDLPEVDLPIDPWFLGYWLGDGHKATATIATSDEEVLDQIRALGYRVTHYARFNYGISTGGRGGSPRPSLQGALREHGLLNNKHIPAAYLRASAFQRAQLLAGLLDADGTCSLRCNGTVVSGQVIFSNVDRGLISGVAELAASLGFVPTARQSRAGRIETHPSSVAYGSTCRPSWVVTFTPDRQVFGIGRKQRQLDQALSSPRRATTRLRYVVDIEPVDSVPVRCITVDSPQHLYLAGRSFIPTHNCRDNFGQRISMGRLSPQGAMMMWENPAVGVSLPRARTGRATATHEDGRPVEVQCYRFPDMDAAEGTEEHQLLEAIRPAHSRHPRLVIVPPEDQADLDSGETGTPTFRDYARATWDLAENRPDLDPLARAWQVDAADGRELSSTLASLGISGRQDRGPRLRTRDPVPAAPHLPDPARVVADNVEPDEYFGYAPATTCSPHALVVGDLIEVEDGSGVWVVVDEAPEDDVVSPGLIAVSWRGDGDESGSLSLPDDLQIAVRRPEEDA